MPRARMQPETKDRLRASLHSTETPLHPPTGGDLVADRIRHWIFEGLLRDGDTLSQEDLADLLGMSRIPVRDGLIALESAGWVRVTPGIGATAVGLDAAAIEDCFELFATIWILIITRAVDKAVDHGSLFEAVRRVQDARTPAEMAAANDEFVTVLCQIANAPRLEAAFHSAGRIVPGDFFAVVPGALEIQRRSVPAIGRAVARSDVATATALAADQHRAHARNLIELLSSRGILQDEPARWSRRSS